jgi:hypothetical protein
MCVNIDGEYMTFPTLKSFTRGCRQPWLHLAAKADEAVTTARAALATIKNRRCEVAVGIDFSLSDRLAGGQELS